MVGCNQRGLASVPCQALEAKLAIEVDVIEAEDREPPGKRPRLLQMEPGVRLVEMRGHRVCHGPTQPFVEIPQDDARAFQFLVDDDPLVDQLASLLALLEETRPEVDVEYMKGLAINANIRAQAAPVLASPGGADVVVLMPLDGVPRQHDIPVAATLMALVLPEGEVEPQLLG